MSYLFYQMMIGKVGYRGGKVATRSCKVEMSFGKSKISSGKIEKTFGKSKTTSGKVVTNDKKDKTVNAKFVTSPHTKANTFAVHARTTHKAKTTKEFAFFPTHMGTLVQFETKRKPPSKKIKTATAQSALT